ncbi:MAG: S8 family serine peptidase [Bdellovibrionota bacterium]
MNFLIALATIVTFTSAAHAGEVLRLKSGAIHANRVNVFSANQEDTGLYMVQWKKNVTEAEKNSVKQAGFKLLSYIPDDAFLAQGDATAAAAAAKLDFVGSVVPYERAMKMEPELNRNGLFSFSDNVKVSVQLAPGADSAAIRGFFSKSVEAGNNVIVGDSSLSSLWNLAARSDVLWIERYLELRNMDISSELVGKSDVRTTATRTGYESGTKILNAETAYAAGFNGAGQIVAYADTGLDTGDMNTISADFRGQVHSTFAVGLGGSSWGDPMNHGTHVAGSIAGNGANSQGLLRGTGFGAQLVVEGMWSDIFNNILPPSVDKLFGTAYNEGARLHSNSWGAPNSNGRYDNMAVQADTFLFQNPDFLAIFAAGNDGADNNSDGVADEGSVSSPGSAKNVLTVGASKNLLAEGGIQKKVSETKLKDTFKAEPIASSSFSEDARGMAAFSSRGPTADGRLKPEVVAPGTNIVSVRSKNPKAKPEDSWGIYDDNYLYMGGTSMATPITAGAMAVVRQYLVSHLGEGVSAAMMKATVANTAEDLFPGQFGARATGQEQPTMRPNNHEGWGRVNLATLVSDRSLALYDEKAGLATGQSKTFKADVRSGQVLRVTMSYTDAPGTASAAKTLVNDLDVKVVDAKGNTFFPNGKTAKDDVNNTEEIDLLTAAPGSYQVIVSGANVPQGKNGAQPYALVVSVR